MEDIQFTENSDFIKETKLNHVLLNIMIQFKNNYTIAKLYYDYFKNKIGVYSQDNDLYFAIYSKTNWIINEKGLFKYKFIKKFNNDMMKLIKIYPKNREIKYLLNISNDSINKILNIIMSLSYTNDMYFCDKLNSKNTYLVPFLNGVFDLTKNIFRNYLFDDYITKKFNCIYNPNNATNLKNYFDFLQNNEIEKYLLLFLASTLEGNTNTNNLVHIFYGNTTTIYSLMHMIGTNFASYSNIRSNIENIDNDFVFPKKLVTLIIDENTKICDTQFDKINNGCILISNLSNNFFLTRRKFILFVKNINVIKNWTNDFLENCIFINFKNKYDFGNHINELHDTFVSSLIPYYYEYKQNGLNVPEVLVKLKQNIISNNINKLYI